MTVITLPGAITSVENTMILNELMRKFGNARRRAFSMKRKGMKQGDIKKILQGELGLNSRYIKDAYYSIIPLHYTCV